MLTRNRTRCGCQAAKLLNFAIAQNWRVDVEQDLRSQDDGDTGTW